MPPGVPCGLGHLTRSLSSLPGGGFSGHSGTSFVPPHTPGQEGVGTRDRVQPERSRAVGGPEAQLCMLAK